MSAGVTERRFEGAAFSPSDKQELSFGEFLQLTEDLLQEADPELEEMVDALEILKVTEWPSAQMERCLKLQESLLSYPLVLWVHEMSLLNDRADAKKLSLEQVKGLIAEYSEQIQKQTDRNHPVVKQVVIAAMESIDSLQRRLIY